MKKAKQKSPALTFYYNGQFIDVSYSFSAYTEKAVMNPNKVWLDILFMHPQKGEAVTMRVAQSTLVLCQSKEMIEGLVHHELRSVLHFSDSPYYHTEVMNQAVAAA